MVDGRVGRAWWDEVKSGFGVRSDEAGAGTGVVVVVSLLLEAGCWKVGLEVSLSARAFCFGTHCRGNSSKQEQVGRHWLASHVKYLHDTFGTNITLKL